MTNLPQSNLVSIGEAEKETTVKRFHSGIVVTVKATLSKYPVVMSGPIKIFKVDENRY